MITVAVLQQSPLLLAILCAVLGLLVGSFLNVVIYRVPIMLQRQWTREAKDVLGHEVLESSSFNLSFPKSSCPKCGHAIRPWENFPILSWLILRGRCAGCNSSISPRYPIIENISGLCSMAVGLRFGWGLSTLFALLLVWASIALFRDALK